MHKRVSDRTGKVSWQTSYTDQQGRRRWISAPTKGALKSKLQTAQGQVADGTHVHDRDTMTIAQAIDNWLDVCENVGRDGREPVSGATLRKYKERARNHIKPLIGSTKLNRFFNPDAKQFRDDLLKRCNRPNAKKCLTDMKSAWAEAMADGHVAHDPFAKIRILTPARTRKRMAIPTQDEMAAIEAAAPKVLSLKRQAQFGVLRWSGCRPEEMRGLPWPCVLGNKRRIRVEQVATEDCDIMDAPKTDSGFRSIVCPQMLFDTLKVWRLKCPIMPSKLVFPTSSGRPESHGNITNRMWYVLMNETGLDYPLYSLRHYRLSERIRNGEDIVEVSEQAGHATPEFTYSTYIHAIRENKAG